MVVTRQREGKARGSWESRANTIRWREAKYESTYSYIYVGAAGRCAAASIGRPMDLMSSTKRAPPWRPSRPEPSQAVPCHAMPCHVLPWWSCHGSAWVPGWARVSRGRWPPRRRRRCERRIMYEAR